LYFDWVASIIRPSVKQLLLHNFSSNVQTLLVPADRTVCLETMVKKIQDTPINGTTTQLNLSDAFTPSQKVFPSDLMTQLPEVEPDIAVQYLKDTWRIILDH